MRVGFRALRKGRSSGFRGIILRKTIRSPTIPYLILQPQYSFRVPRDLPSLRNLPRFKERAPDTKP